MLRRTVIGLAALVCVSVPAASRAGNGADAEPITFPVALARALEDSPRLAAFSKEIRAREAEAQQAGLRPNPVISLEAENVAGSGEFSGTGASETTLSLSQTLELGGKRERRRHLAEAQVAAAGKDYDLARAEVLARTQERFYALLAAQERLALAGELRELAGRALKNVEERISAGKAAEMERTRALIALADLRVMQEKARHAVEAARQAMAAEMGLSRADFGPALGEIARLPALPGFADLEREFPGSPELARQLAEVEARRRGVALERARRIPDLEVGLGARYLRESEDTALVLGLSIPLPLFDRNQGGIAAAQSRLARARDEEKAATLQTRAALAGAWQEMTSAHEEARALQDEILPAARSAVDAIEYGYGAGKFGILDVLDAQRTLVEARGRHLDALSSFHRSCAELERLLGRELPKVPETSSSADSAKE